MTLYEEGASGGHSAARPDDGTPLNDGVDVAQAMSTSEATAKASSDTRCDMVTSRLSRMGPGVDGRRGLWASEEADGPSPLTWKAENGGGIIHSTGGGQCTRMS